MVKRKKGGSVKDESNGSSHLNGKGNTNEATNTASNERKYKLDPKEFGPVEDSRHLYKQTAGTEIDFESGMDDQVKMIIFIEVYLCYLVLIIIGHIRDFCSKWFSSSGISVELKKVDGYAPLLSDFESFYTRRLKHRLDDCFARQTTGVPGRIITINDRYTEDFNNSYIYPGTTTECINLSSYNYLGFAQSVGQCTDAAEATIYDQGIISGGSRDLGATSTMHLETEKIIAEFLGKEAAVIYSMGYATNGNIFASLIDSHCLVISDELNHASIRFGCRVSGAVIKIFRHNNMEELENLLREQISRGQPRTHRPWKKILIVVEGLYSMEGTMCNLPKLVELRDKYKIYLFVDEAHSVGAMGPNGRGVCDYFNIDPSRIDIMMGTLTKSFGATGGYIAADKKIIDYIRVHNMADLYAEATAPPVLAQIQESLKTITGEVAAGEGQERLQKLAFNSRYLRLGLKRLGFIVYGTDDSPIIPLLLLQPAKMPAFSRMMLEKKIAVVVVGYPATPLPTSRVRFCLSASLTKEDLDEVLYACEEIGSLLSLKISQQPSRLTGKPVRMSIAEAMDTLVEDVQGDISHL